MVRQRIERKDLANLSKMPNLPVDAETETFSDAGLYFKSSVKFGRMADGRFAWAGVMASIAGLGALVLLCWSQIEADSVSATEPRPDPSSSLAAAPQFAMQNEPSEELKRRGLELLRTEFPEHQPSPPLEGGDRLELHDATTKPVMGIATAGEDDSVAAPAAFSVPTAASPPAEAKVSKPAGAREKQAVERPVHRLHARRALTHRRDRVRMAHAKYVQAREPQMTSAGRPQPEQAQPEETKAFGSVAPWSSWKDNWDKLWSKGTGG